MTNAEALKQSGEPQAAMCSAEAGARRVRMLVPVDCTELGEAVLETAACTARLLNAEVHLITVVPPEHERVTLQPLATSDLSSDGAVWSDGRPPTGAD